jgi:hypothetical protein
MKTRAVWWRARWIGLAVSLGTLFQTTCIEVLTTPEGQAQLREQFDAIGRRQITNLVTDTVYFFLDNALVRLVR